MGGATSTRRTSAGGDEPVERYGMDSARGFGQCQYNHRGANASERCLLQRDADNIVDGELSRPDAAGLRSTVQRQPGNFPTHWARNLHLQHISFFFGPVGEWTNDQPSTDRQRL
jgi:hypothetical protein